MNFIKEFWDNQAKKFGASSDASWGDIYALQLEIDNISKYIEVGDKVLDAGCANGYAAEAQFLRKDINIEAIDFSDEMINQAWPRTFNGKKSSLRFQVADIKKLPFEDNIFDVTYTTRVLINLPNWEDQIKGIEECIRVTKEGGKIILSEAFYEPLQKLNALRLICGLEPLVEHDFNRYIKHQKIQDLLLNKGFSDEFIGKNSFFIEDFSSVYYLGSRFLRELVSKKKYPGYSDPINEKFFNLENEFSGGGFGIQQAYIIRK